MYADFDEGGRMELTLYTDALITRGGIRTRQHRVTDVLNLTEDPFLILEDVIVDEYGERGSPVRAAYAQVNLDTVLFAVANTAVPTLPELRTPKTPEQAILSVPPFRIVGTIHLMPSEGNLRHALHELSGRFLPVTDAVFWSDRLGEGRQQALILAVNHRRAQILAPHREVDPWAGIDGGPRQPTEVDPIVDPWTGMPTGAGQAPDAPGLPVAGADPGADWPRTDLAGRDPESAGG
jgi:hypothetical protein